MKQELSIFHIALGFDALNAIERTDRARLEELDRWRALSQSTDFAGE